MLQLYRKEATHHRLDCEGAQGLREMLLLPDQSKYNLEASAAYIADQKAQGSTRR